MCDRAGGVFDITMNGQLRFSKKQLGRFPTDQEIEAQARFSAPSQP
jgi:predicted Rdx family selenoprotein